MTESEPRRRNAWWVRHYTFTGTAVGLVFIWFSMTPSLLPRGPLFQGLVSGLAGAIGYGIGVFAVWLVRFMRSRDSSPPAPRRAWLALIGVGAVGMIAMVIWFHVWQDRVRNLMGVKHLTWHDYPLTTALSLVVLFGVVEAGQLIRRLVHFLDLRLDRFAPPRVSAVIVVTLLLVLTTAILNGVVVSTSSSVTTITAETRGGAKRSSRKSRKWTSRRMSWPASTTPNSTTNDRAVVNG